MIALDITPNIEENPWTDCVQPDGLPIDLGLMERIGLLPRGTGSGQPVVIIKCVLPDGSIAVAQTSWKLFRGAARALAAAVETYGMMEGVPDE